MSSRNYFSFRKESNAVLLLCMMFVSCSNCELFISDDPSRFSMELCKLNEEGVSIDRVSFLEDEYCILLSNGEHISLHKEDISLFTFDEIESWCKNGYGTTSTLDGRMGIDSNSELISILEGFAEWFFVFSNGKIIPLAKTGYNYDPDITLRGINHRGYNRNAPENTLAAFRLSRLMGFRYVETDVQITKDGIPVLLHDYSIDRTSDGEGEISNLSWDQVRKFDFGSWKSQEYEKTPIPSLEEFLLLCKQMGLIPYLELKATSHKSIQDIVSLVNKYGLSEDVKYISFSTSILKSISEIQQYAALGVLTGTPLSESVISTALSLKTNNNSVFIDSSDYSESAVFLCREARIPLEIWTVNSKEIVLSMSSYISGVTSDIIHAGRVLKDSKDN